MLEYVVRSLHIDTDPKEGDARTEVDFDSAPIAALADDLLRAAGLDPSPELRPIAQDRQVARTIENHLRYRLNN